MTLFKFKGGIHPPENKTLTENLYIKKFKDIRYTYITLLQHICSICESILCNNKEKGQIAKLNCSISCIACGLCSKACPVNAIEVTRNLAKIDHSKCINCGICILKCPTKSIYKNIKIK